MIDPKIYLSIDNCFASKRWVEPAEWFSIVDSLGLKYVEASADTECDPFYHGNDYLDRWFHKTAEASVKTGVKISSLYSGHGTYSTLGLAHTDDEVRRRFIDGWMKPMIRLAGRLGTSMGFFCHAFPEKILSDPAAFSKKKAELTDTFCELSEYGAECGCRTLSVEQMYSPHQMPWTIDQANDIINEVSLRTGNPFYLTIDVGHMYSQKKFMRPGKDVLSKAGGAFLSGRVSSPDIWTGYTDLYEYFADVENEEDIKDKVKLVESDMDRYGYMFCNRSDSDPYIWLASLGGYSPTIHLQQTDGSSSSHLAFTDDNNLKGIISPPKLINSIKSFYENHGTEGSIPPIENIFLTLELFSSNGDYVSEILRKLEESVSFWRKFIPQDGKLLSSFMFDE